MAGINSSDLYNFIKKASHQTWAGGGQYEEVVERSDHKELLFKDKGKDLEYRDSFVGYTRSHGSEVVRYKDKPIWATGYRGGMVEGFEKLADDTFEFLKKAMTIKEEGFNSFRGPHEMLKGDWKYEYKQEGDLKEFFGSEKIYHKDTLVFYHRIVGGLVVE